MRPDCKKILTRRWMQCGIVLIGCLGLMACGGGASSTTATLPPIITFSQPNNPQQASMGYVTAYDSSSGHQRWRQTFPHLGNFIALRATSNAVYFLSGPLVQALDPTTGKTTWSYQAPEADSDFIGIDALAGDTLYATEVVGNNDEDLVAIDTNSGTPRWRFHAASDVLVVATSQAAYAIQGGGSSDLHPGSVPTALRAFSAHGNGTPLWTDAQPPLNAADDLALGGDGTVYLNNNMGVSAIDPTTGTQRWRFANPMPGVQQANSAIAVAGSTVITSFNDNLLVAVQANSGTLQWKTPYSGAPNGVVINILCVGAQQLVLQWGGGDVEGTSTFALTSGQALWNSAAQLKNVDDSTRFTCDGQTLYTTGRQGVGAFRLSDGSMRWQNTTYAVDNGPNGNLTTPWHGLLLANGSDANAGTIGLLALNAQTGNKVWLTTLPLAGGQPSEMLEAIATVGT